MGTDSITPPEGYTLDDEIQPPAGYTLDEPKTVTGLVKNAASDVGGYLKQGAEAGKTLIDPANVLESAASGSIEPTKQKLSGDFQALKKIPSDLVKEGERIGGGQLLKGDLSGAANKFGQAAYDKPVTTGMDVASIFGLVKGLPGAPEVDALPNAAVPEAPKAPVSEPPLLNPKPAESISAAPKEAPAPAQTAGLPFTNEAQQALSKAKEVKDYIGKKYEGFAKKPGVPADIADWFDEKSQMMANQQMGATPLQARQVGHEGMRAIGKYAQENGIVDPTTGLRGMRQKQIALNEAAGKTIGALRDEADSLRDPLQTPVDVLQAVREKFDPIFSRGARSSEKGAYAKALQEIEDSEATFHGVSKLATKLNKAANEANRLNQPHGAYTDIANFISDINNERIKQLVGPEKAAQYEQALRDFGVTKKIGEFLNRKEAGEVKRLGPGSVLSNFAQKGLDEFGYRAGAKTFKGISDVIKRNPGAAKSLPSLFKEFIHQIDETGKEVGGMSEGGMVTPDMADFVKRQSGGTR